MDGVAQVRRFNRALTRRIGALDEHFLGRDRSLGASRLLIEIGEIGALGAEVRALRARLGLDSGYLSRLLRALEREGLVRLAPSPDDARVRLVALTGAGAAEVALLERLSDEAAASLLAPLGEAQRRRLVEALATAEGLLTAASVRIGPEDAASPTARHCLERYFAELAARFEGGFDPARSATASLGELSPPRGLFVVARLDDEPVGCGALRNLLGVAEVKRMWVDASVRGLGVGRRLLATLEGLARERGHAALRLETNRALTEAQALYRASGYREVAPFNDEPYAHHWFEKAL